MIIDLSTSPYPPSRPSLFASVPSNRSSSSSQAYRLHQIGFTLSELRVWSHVQTALSFPDETQHSREVAELLREVVMGWVEIIWMTFIQSWFMLGPAHALRLTGEDILDSGTYDRGASSESRGHATQHEDNSHSARSALLLQDRGSTADSAVPSSQVIRNVVEVILGYIAFLDTRASSYLPALYDGGFPRIELLPRDVGSFDLNPFSHPDVEFCRQLVKANLRRRGLLDEIGHVINPINVQITRPWCDMLAWLMGWG